MAAPQTTTIKSLSGQYTLNRSLSDDPDTVLQLQGLSYLLRSAISLASITLHISQYTPSPSTSPSSESQPQSTHIDINQILTMGIPGTSENRTLDWAWRGHEDRIFGKVRGRSRFVTLGELRGEYEKDGKDEERDFLASDDLHDDTEGGGDGTVVQSYVTSNLSSDTDGEEEEGEGWIADQTWSVTTTSLKGKAEKERRYVRHVLVRKGEEKRKVRLVYDWLGPLSSTSSNGSGSGSADKEDDGLAYE